MKIESLNQRKQELEKKEIQLKESVIKFDKFLKVLYLKEIIVKKRDTFYLFVI